MPFTHTHLPVSIHIHSFIIVNCTILLCRHMHYSIIALCVHTYLFYCIMCTHFIALCMHTYLFYCTMYAHVPILLHYVCTRTYSIALCMHTYLFYCTMYAHVPILLHYVCTRTYSIALCVLILLHYAFTLANNCACKCFVVHVESLFLHVPPICDYVSIYWMQEEEGRALV